MGRVFSLEAPATELPAVVQRALAAAGLKGGLRLPGRPEDTVAAALGDPPDDTIVAPDLVGAWVLAELIRRGPRGGQLRAHRPRAPTAGGLPGGVPDRRGRRHAPARTAARAPPRPGRDGPPAGRGGRLAGVGAGGRGGGVTPPPAPDA